MNRDWTRQRLKQAEAEFLAACPDYANTAELDQLRAAEYGRLDKLEHVYLDYTGSGLYAESQVREHSALLQPAVFANPHSHNPTSMAATERVESCRRKILEYFSASPEEYVAIFTANASAALKLVGESFPFADGGEYLLTFDNHNSVNGIREFARARGAEITYIPLTVPELRVDEEVLEEHLTAGRSGTPRLFAYPAQSNFSGVQHPLSWIEKARSKGWTVLLDAAAFVPTNRLDLGLWHPDFVSLSFYKMFGYPTGVGCLLARAEALKTLRRPWFAGGTITVASVQGDRHFMQEGASAFEDGTVDFLGIPAVEVGLRHLETAGIQRIHDRCRRLAGYLIERLLCLILSP
jgi:molybdenum cofactor sulfurtransferase